MLLRNPSNAEFARQDASTLLKLMLVMNFDLQFGINCRKAWFLWVERRENESKKAFRSYIVNDEQMFLFVIPISSVCISSPKHWKEIKYSFILENKYCSTFSFWEGKILSAPTYLGRSVVLRNAYGLILALLI